MIKAIGHVALQVPNLDDSVGWATTVMGLREVARQGDVSYLTHGGSRHSLIYRGGRGSARPHLARSAGRGRAA